MPKRGVLVLTLVVAAVAFPASHNTNTRAYRMWRHRMFIAAYDELIVKLKVFADSWDGKQTSEFPVSEANAVRRAWKKLIELEPWFRPSEELDGPEESCPTDADETSAFRHSYKTLVSALNTFLTHYAADNALTFSAPDAAAVRRRWRCLVHLAPGFDKN